MATRKKSAPKEKKPGVEVIFRLGDPDGPVGQNTFQIGIHLADDLVRRGLAAIGQIDLNDTAAVLGQLSRIFDSMQMAASLEPPNDEGKM
jgi:hypothetical protein